MYKILISPDAINTIKEYSTKYRSYFENIYLDSWIWSQDKIIDWYKAESVTRYKEIRTVIKKHLENNIVSYVNNEAILKWRSKILLVSFIEQWNTRIITDIEIR